MSEANCVSACVCVLVFDSPRASRTNSSAVNGSLKHITCCNNTSPLHRLSTATDRIFTHINIPQHQYLVCHENNRLHALYTLFKLLSCRLCFVGCLCDASLNTRSNQNAQNFHSRAPAIKVLYCHCHYVLVVLLLLYTLL